MAAAFSAAGETVSPSRGTQKRIEANESPDESEEETGNPGKQDTVIHHRRAPLILVSATASYP